MRLDPAHPFKRDPLPPHELGARFTATPHILCHLSVPRIEPGEWSLTIDGLVERPRTLGLDELLRYPKVELDAVHQCCGSPLAPFEPTRRVAHVRWGGARLSTLLAEAGPRAEARFLWSSGADSGEIAGVHADAYVKDLPLARVAEDVLLAYEMNGAPLLGEHGFPVRLFVPGFYGTNNVKWLTRLTLAARRASSPFTSASTTTPCSMRKAARRARPRRCGRSLPSR
jgi:DMSO/TMAO reductase YedYZ molybdopterin-dependent catalytic subunit